MATFLYKTIDDTDPKDRPRVYFTCHPDDFEDYFTRITKAIFATHDCAIYYTADMEEPINREDLETDLGQMNLFVVPVTWDLLTEPCRAMEVDIAYAKKERIPILPFVMESGLDEVYAEPENFGKRQYLNLFDTDATAIPYEEKLRKYLESVLISDELAKRIRSAFDAYIFLSYRKKDRRYANELMKLIHKNPECRDIAIWYDEFLTPGESFVDNIEKALKGSNLFTLLVTPNILEEPEGKPNYVMAEEYPAARKAGKYILPVEMERTDRCALQAKFEEIPECADPRNETAFKERLLSAIRKIAVSANKNEPEHCFLIGLAYREGIDVETDRQRGMEMITIAAEAELPEAMDHLYRIYSSQTGNDDDEDERNEELALRWAKRRAESYAKRYGEENTVTAMAMADLATACVNIVDWAAGSGSIDDDVFYYFSDEFLQEAAQNAKNAYARCLKVFGEEDDCTVECLRALAALLEELDHDSGTTEEWKEANELREKEYALCRKMHGTHWMTGRAMECLMRSCLQGRRFERRLELMEEMFGPECPENADEELICQWALAYGDVGRDREEKALLEKLCAGKYGMLFVFTGIQKHLQFAWGERRKTLLETEYELACRFWDDRDERTMSALSGLAFAYDSCGDVLKAVECMEKYILQCGEQDGYFATMVIERLAEIYCDLGEYEKVIALSVGYFALQCRSETNALMEDQTPVQMHADAYLGMGDCAKALQLQKRAYEMIRNQFGDDDPKTWIARSRLARICCRLHDYTTAMEWQQNAYERLCEEYLPDDVQSINSLTVLAQIRRGMGEYGEAIELLQRAYLLLRSTWGDKHRYTLKVAGELANTYTVAGEYEKAAELESLAHSAWCEMLGEDHANVRNAANHLAYLHFKLGDMEKALEEKGKVMVSRCNALEIADPVGLMALRNLSYDYRGSDDPAAEMAFDTQVYTLLCDTLGAEHAATISAQSGLAYVCFVCGQGQKAYAHFREACGHCRRIFGEYNFVTIHALRQFESRCGDPAGEDYAQILRWML